jgi:protein-L-isoaspartate(D-aspartate) O-methyltransferase
MNLRSIVSMLGLLTALSVDDTRAEDAFARARAALLEEIAAMARETARETGRPAYSAEVMAAIAAVPRQRFVSQGQQSQAYANRPLPIGHGQTISQPYIVALMTDLLDPKPGDSVLEIGTGSGYQAAVLSGLVKTVYSIEIVEPVGRRAAELLRQLGYANVVTRIGDGYAGWPDAAPFDSIIVTAAAPRVPPALVEQLKTGGRMVIPLGGAGDVQFLNVLVKNADGSVATRNVLPVRFVPLTRADNP